MLSDCVGSYFPEFQRAGLAMIAAQGGIFGWVAVVRRDRRTSSRPSRPEVRPEVLGVIMNLIRPASPAVDRAFKVPWWTRGDTNAFFGLGFNVLVNVLMLTGLCLGVVKISRATGVRQDPARAGHRLIGQRLLHLPGAAARRREDRTDVTAMPYGPSVPHMFIVVFVIMLPIYLTTGDPVRAWAAGLAWAFIIGVIVLIGAFVGPYIRKYTPQAAMLGTLAGISIAFISMRPAAQMWEARGSRCRCWCSSWSASSPT